MTSSAMAQARTIRREPVITMNSGRSGWSARREPFQGCRNSPDARARSCRDRRRTSEDKVLPRRLAAQSHPSATPEPPTTSPAPVKTRRSRIQERTTSGGNFAVEQHEGMAGLVASPGLGVSIAGGAIGLSKPSMTVVLALPDPCQNRKGVEQPVGKARQLPRQDSDAHAGDDCARAELQVSAKPTKTP